ncbi:MULTISPECIES: DNA-directed RNA polymerase subunit beta [Bacillaceae]|uniref:DNA-directed RNA polymerase subunit beta n=1 Tax=Evansella alkalicola TaxID=745819 RepID=A0ABS6K1X1_9BACI|nr:MULTISPECIES: DNA-directed RNA polymerase subunit beta [Bacillaceae]MBU9723420.1 DNA-directed RNA polymerase subunit beta [Bacillus alkalicola]
MSKDNELDLNEQQNSKGRGSEGRNTDQLDEQTGEASQRPNHANDDPVKNSVESSEGVNSSDSAPVSGEFESSGNGFVSGEFENSGNTSKSEDFADADVQEGEDHTPTNLASDEVGTAHAFDEKENHDSNIGQANVADSTSTEGDSSTGAGSAFVSDYAQGSKSDTALETDSASVSDFAHEPDKDTTIIDESVSHPENGEDVEEAVVTEGELGAEEDGATIMGESNQTERTPNETNETEVDHSDASIDTDSMVFIDDKQEAEITPSRSNRSDGSDLVEETVVAEEEETDNMSETRSRRKLRLEKEQEAEATQKSEKRSKRSRKPRGRIRLIPVWLKVIVVVSLLAGSLVVGAMVGFGLGGDGDPRSILDKETWYYVYDLIFADTEMDRQNIE